MLRNAVPASDKTQTTNHTKHTKRTRIKLLGEANGLFDGSLRDFVRLVLFAFRVFCVFRGSLVFSALQKASHFIGDTFRLSDEC